MRLSDEKEHSAGAEVTLKSWLSLDISVTWGILQELVAVAHRHDEGSRAFQYSLVAVILLS